MIVTSPNQEYVPQYPRQCDVIRMFSDGLWGIHEYTRWPQELVLNMWHIACIPPEEDWQEDRRGGVRTLGYLRMPIVEELASVAEMAIAGFRAIPGLTHSRRALGDQLCLLLHQPAIAVVVGAHVQRLSLELAGLKLYLGVIAARIDSPQDYSTSVLPVLGAFVKEATLAQTCTWVGLPVWFLQDLTPHTKIWRVVKPMEVYDLSSQDSQPPILHHPDDCPGILNLTGNWMTTMVQAVSHQLCSPALPSIYMPAPDPFPDSKRAGTSQNSERLAQSGQNLVSPHTPTPHPSPSLQYTRSPFFRLSECWEHALRLAGELPQPYRASLYFFAPPFLLDTVSPETTPPCDLKIARYLHNLVRIRLFCRLRLLDPTISAHPLTISEWRMALWGEYNFKEPPQQVEGGSGRPKRQREAANKIFRLFGNVASLEEYKASDEPDLGGQHVTYEMAAEDLRAHEVNWRCEVMALDEAVVSRAGWPCMYRWEREADVSAVWGETGGVMSAVKSYAWPLSQDPQWWSALPTLQAFLRVMSQWPDYPQSLRDLPADLADWMNDDYNEGQQTGALFYTHTFVKYFHHLPIVPIEFPLEYKI
ncbi:hypothetical protein C8Q79DRAFT_1002435 [Trametes meyenii]|nr:hypothetical protein C8Q79DRAFT_1002435 [Trametes meyenii]